MYGVIARFVRTRPVLLVLCLAFILILLAACGGSPLAAPTATPTKTPLPAQPTVEAIAEPTATPVPPTPTEVVEVALVPTETPTALPGNIAP